MLVKRGEELITFTGERISPLTFDRERLILYTNEFKRSNNMNNFLVRSKVHCLRCRKELKKGQKIKGAEYHEECWEKRNWPRAWELFTKADR